MDLIKESFPPDIAELFRVCLTGSYFSWNSNYYEQTEGVTMGSPISPIIANFFMERFEEKALESSVLKPAVWFRYVDDTFVVWKHGRDSLDDFLHHLNTQSPSIKFTMETEVNNQLAFLDVLVKRNGDHLDHTVYRKPTHRDRYLHNLSNHHPSQKQGIFGTLANRARRICAKDHIQEELSHLKPFLLTGTRLTEHKRSCGLGQTDKSAVAEHALRDGDHKIQFKDTQVIAATSGYHPRLIREAVEIHKHPNNFNRKEETLYLNRIRHPAISRTKVAVQRSRPVSEEPPP
ncbi:uncharacterized protein LOC115884178 [Sitophilus oryzae]|uniref:Uncharacterized protein LOC115884178 n=1 Tax=Sitophilus oryzae TaxID=7048 RepID=A0A6J2Y5L8_SITOR|nr:uncharacterized protein LOC115884178 [Sitophilus oryzae]